jgi:hypothetical protein
VSDPTVIYCDNLNNIQLAKNLVFHTWTKHIEVHYHFVRECVLSGEVELRHVLTDRKVADIFTKALGLDKLRQFSGALGLRHLDVPNLRGREPGLRADRSEKAESEREVDSDVPNQPGESLGRAHSPRQIRTHGRIRRTHRKRHGRNSNKAVKGIVSTGGLAATGRKGRWGSDR